MRRVLAAAIVGCSVGVAADAAVVTSVPSQDGQTVIVLRGDIVDGDSARLLDAIRAANAAGRRVSGVRLDSPGGSLVEGMRLATALRDGRIASVVANGATCASACFVAFAGGAEKFVSHSANVGVHGASVNGRSSGDGTVSMAKAVKDFGVPAGIIGKMVVTPPNEMVWLTPDELRSMGTTMTGKPAQAVARLPEQPPAQAAAPKQAATVPSWQDLTNRAFDLSRDQYGGRPKISRVCQPEQKSCSTAVFYKNKDGKETMLRTTENVSGQIIERQICDFNDFIDIRSCFDWDRMSTTKEMKDIKGEWRLVPD